MEEMHVEEMLERTLERYRIEKAPPSMYYIADFISDAEEQHILSKIPSNKWISLSHRRLQTVPAPLTANNTLLASPMPEWLTDPVVSRFNDLELFKGAPHGVNHCLINEYLPGQGIMPHEDGAAYHPVVATVSLSGTLVLDVTEKRAQEDSVSSEPRRWRILQEPRSLLVTVDPAYTETLHGIKEVEVDADLNADTVANWSLLGDAGKIAGNGGRNERTERVSLTYRDVRKVSKVGSKIFGRPKK